MYGITVLSPSCHVGEHCLPILQVVLREDQSLEDGRVIAEELMVSLGVEEDHLLTGAYMDMILEGQSRPSDNH